MKIEGILSTKAQTLSNLQILLKKSKIEELYFFKVGDWEKEKDKILSIIDCKFKDKIVVRSSSTLEDTLKDSKAGCFESVLNVDPKNPTESIEKVISSYVFNDSNEVLIQTQTQVEISGVILTRKRDGAPYYVINYDTAGSTDSVTSGIENKHIEIIRHISSDLLEYPWYNVIEAVREIEDFVCIPIDIEFGINLEGNVVIFQVRPMTAVPYFTLEDDMKIFREVEKAKHSFKGIYSDMAFWNPAEMIGDRPKPLDYSLYRYLITKDVWNSALIPLGYTKVEGDLMTSICGKPYIDLEKVFNTLLPAKVIDRGSIIEFFKQKVYQYPELHDKVEFEVVPNCYHYDMENVFFEIERTGINIEGLSNELKDLTDNALSKFEGWITIAKADLLRMEEKRKDGNRDLKKAKQLLEDCRDLGVTNFTRIARYAFIAKAFIESLVSSGKVTEKEKDDFFSSLYAFTSVYEEENYGHLRPGTYDITSTRYDMNERIRKREHKNKKSVTSKTPDVLKFEKRFVSTTLRYRELIKFEFTKNISEALEIIAEVGEQKGFSREDMSYLDIETIFTDRDDIEELWESIIAARKEKRKIYEKVSLPSLLFSKNDLMVVHSYISKPNFISDMIIKGKVCYLNKSEVRDLKDKIVLIENADPGFDWIFSENLKALITCYGGVASHMSIRCAEFGIPAAIGCGRTMFENLKNKEEILLDCKKGKICINS